ncbi:MAG: putative secreted protein [Pseudobdellovibrio sp.]|jgi:uncharacterized membrane protein (UPF0127 family)|nr:putative secreted protein [Pseudobdellovibrio sp.]
MKLYKTTESNAELLADQLKLADGFYSRAKGLLGQNGLASNQGLWIKPCRDIHTFFMKFSIDCVFLDRKMQIIKIAAGVSPFRLVGPFWKSESVMEFQAGFVEEKKLKVGDQLYVVS